MKMLSVVIPAFNEQENIKHTADVISGILQKANIPYEIIFVSDGSRDDTFEEVYKLSKQDSRILGVEFSRNFGKEAAIFAGLEMVSGSCAVVIDCDLQHPPEVIPQMYQLWKGGADVVEGMKSSRGNESFLHKAFVGLFYGIMSKLMKMNMHTTSDFKLLDRKVIDVLLGLQERNTFFRALSFWVGFQSETVHYDVQERQLGESKWSFMSLLRYAISNTTSFTTVPLQMVTFLGVLSIIISVVLGIQTLVNYFLGTSAEGFPTVILLILIIGGFIMLSLGVLGHYLGRIYEEVKARPRYIVASDTRKKVENETTN